MIKQRKCKLLWSILILAVVLATGFVTEYAAVFAQAANQKSDEKTIASVDDLKGSRIGVQLGTTGDIYASDYEKEGTAQVLRYNKGADAIQALKQKKIDCVLIDEQPAKAYVEKNPELKILEQEFAVEDYAICVSKKNKDLTDKINQAIDEINADGTKQKIIDYYINGKGERYTSSQKDYPNGKIVMATNAEFPPYEYFDNGEIIGIDADMARAIADKMGMKLEISNMEFASVIISVQSGKADFGMSGITVTEDRKKNIDFTQSYATSKQVVIIKNPEAATDDSKQGFFDNVKSTFLDGDRWKYIPKGLLNTIIITVFAGMIGILIGFMIANIRVAYDRNDESGPGTKIANFLVKIYLTIFRGTPMMVQLLIMYYVIFSNVKLNAVIVAILAFGLNSGAYVAEAMRSGIISIPTGQFEAGRSLGFNYSQTMKYVIMPQAVKNALPAMLNEFIALLKESSIVGYIGLMDLTKAGDIIRSGTYSAFLPLITVAVIYLVIVMIMTAFVGRLERRLHKDGR